MTNSDDPVRSVKVDHVSIGWSDLSAIQKEFSAVGMATEYGGPHSGGQTHMSLLGFRDGSYIELISTVKPGTEATMWKKQIEEDGGPCAWCAGSDDIAADVARAKSLGIPASGPGKYTRKRPDGVLAKWELGFLGGGEAGSTLPFIIKDETPRSFRVRPSKSVSLGLSPLVGIGAVVLAVEDLDASASLFRKYYSWRDPARSSDFVTGAELAWFKGTPVVLAAPRGDGWLSQRLSKFGPSPAAFLIQSDNLERANLRHPLGPKRPWFDGNEVGWVRPLEVRGIMLGVLGR